MDFAIIAAGEGSRLVDEGISQPKPLVLLGGVPLIERLIRIFIRNHATSINVIVNEEMKTVREHLQGLQLSVPVNLVVKSTPSSMHSFYELSPHLTSGRFCLTTVDTVFKEEEFERYIQSFYNEEADGLMAVTDFIDDEKPLYVNVDDNLAIRSFTDEAEQGSRYISGGIYGLKASAIPVLANAIEKKQLRMRNFQRSLVAEGLKLKAWPFSKIIDIDHATDIKVAEQFLNLL